MVHAERLVVAAWGGNLALILALNPHDFSHCLSVLVLYSAVFFLYLAPLHALLAGAAWLSRPALGEIPWLASTLRWLCAESLVYWAIYWGMMLQLVPLNLRV